MDYKQDYVTHPIRPFNSKVWVNDKMYAHSNDKMYAHSNEIGKKYGIVVVTQPQLKHQHQRAAHPLPLDKHETESR